MPHQGQSGIVFESDGLRLLGTLFLAPGDEPKPTALLLHGLPGIEKNYDLAHALRDDGWNSLIFHYRGCWGSEGAYCLQTIPRDVRAAVDELGSGRYPEVDPAQLVMIGHSLGGWAALLAATEDERVRAVAVYGAVTEPTRFPLGRESVAEQFTPWLTGISATELAEQWRALDAAFTPTRQVAQLGPRPLLILHGRADEVVPFEHAELLHQAATGPTELIAHEEANHAFSWHRPWLRARLLDWLHRLQERLAAG